MGEVVVLDATGGRGPPGLADGRVRLTRTGDPDTDPSPTVLRSVTPK